MNSLDIIQFGLYFMMAYAGYKWGFEVGFDRGNVHGRKTIQKHYERVSK
jgi:hypothetical protein